MTRSWVWVTRKHSLVQNTPTRLLEADVNRRAIVVDLNQSTLRFWPQVLDTPIYTASDVQFPNQITDLLYPGLAAQPWFFLQTTLATIELMITEGFDYETEEKGRKRGQKSVRVKIRRR